MQMHACDLHRLKAQNCKNYFHCPGSLIIVNEDVIISKEVADFDNLTDYESRRGSEERN